MAGEYGIQRIGSIKTDPSDILEIRTIMVQIMGLVVAMLVMVMVVAMQVVAERSMLLDIGVMFILRFVGVVRIFLERIKVILVGFVSVKIAFWKY